MSSRARRVAIADASDRTETTADWNAVELAVEHALHDLPASELQVLRLRFGIGAAHHSSGAVARRLRVSAARVSRLERRALRDLRALSLPQDLIRRRSTALGVALSDAGAAPQERRRFDPPASSPSSPADATPTEQSSVASPRRSSTRT